MKSKQPLGIVIVIILLVALGIYKEITEMPKQVTDLDYRCRIVEAWRF